MRSKWIYFEYRSIFIASISTRAYLLSNLYPQFCDEFVGLFPSNLKHNSTSIRQTVPTHPSLFFVSDFSLSLSHINKDSLQHFLAGDEQRIYEVQIIFWLPLLCNQKCDPKPNPKLVLHDNLATNFRGWHTQIQLSVKFYWSSGQNIKLFHGRVARNRKRNRNRACNRIQNSNTDKDPGRLTIR